MLSRKLFFLSLVFLFCLPHKIFSSHSVSFNKNNSDFTTEKKRPHLPTPVSNERTGQIVSSQRKKRACFEKAKSLKKQDLSAE